MPAIQPEPIRLPSRVQIVRSVAEIPDIPADVVAELEPVSAKYAFRSNDYYLGLIDWSDPADPIRRLIIPDPRELEDWGQLDASNEAANTVARGVQHKYADTALVLTASTCGAYCRYCFRKRLFMRHNEETAHDFTAAYAHVARHPEITDVLLTGGDPLVLSTARLAPVIRRFAAMPHVRTVRIGSKMLAFNPFRILDDAALLDVIERTVAGGTALYVMAHFDHPRELTAPAREAIRTLQESGAHVVNQCPLIRGVNDDVDVLVELFQTATELGMPQYYLFQGRPTAGNEPYEVSMVEGWQLFDEARRRCSGLSRRVRYAMSHATGKIEVLGVDDERIYLRYHRARDPENESRILVRARDDEAYWLDDLDPVH
jgi:KamA family protein